MSWMLLKKKDGFDGEESQLPNDLANSLNVNHTLGSYYSVNLKTRNLH